MTIFGWDMSNWDNPSIGNAVGEGFAFITHKAGGDTRDGDQELGAWWRSVKGTDPAKTLLGTYWVPRPDMYPNAASEPGRWLAMLDANCPGWRDRPHMLQIDAERWPAGDQTKPSKAYIQSIASRLRGLMPKLVPIVYASAGQYGNSLTGLGLPLWNANYPSSMTGAASAIYAHVGGDSGPGWRVYSGQTPAIWQFTSSATIAGQTTCDANAYRGTLTQLTALVAPGWSVPDVELTDKYGDDAWPGRTVADRLRDDAKLRDVLWGDKPGTAAAKLDPASPLGKLIATPAKLDALTAEVNSQAADIEDIKNALATLAGQPAVQVSQEELNAAVYAALKQLAAGAA